MTLTEPIFSAPALFDYSIARFTPISLDEANVALSAWGHRMGPLHRGTQGAICHGLFHCEELVAVTTVSLLIREADMEGFPMLRSNCCELSRLCAARPGLCRRGDSLVAGIRLPDFRLPARDFVPGCRHPFGEHLPFRRMEARRLQFQRDRLAERPEGPAQMDMGMGEAAMSIPTNYTIPGKPALYVSRADQDRCRLIGSKTLSGTNRRMEFCDQCPWRGRGASNLAQHRRRAHKARS